MSADLDADVGAPTAVDAAVLEQQPRSRPAVIGAFLAAAVLAVGIPLGIARTVGTPEGDVHEIVIPDGTAARLAAGDDVAIIPPELRLRARDRLVVFNEDRVAHRIGPVSVEPGTRVEQRVSSAMDSSAYCSLHPSGTIEISVSS